MTAVPPVTFGPTGFLIPSEPAVLAGVQTDNNAAFGGNLNPALDTPQGQLSTSEAAVIGNTNSTFQFFTTQVDPAFATGRMQDAIARIYFLERIPSQPTTLQLACSGLSGVTIPLGALVTDPNSNIYQCTGSGTIPGSGSVTLTFAAQVPGPLVVPPSVSIYQAVTGWDSASIASGIVGQNTETRQAFEARRAASVAQNSVGSLSSIQGAVLSVPGVLDAFTTENPTASPLTVGGVALVPNSLYVAVYGGAPASVAGAIWAKKAPGCAYNGNTTVVVTDSNSGYTPPAPTYSVTFEIPPPLAVTFAVNIANNAQIPSNAATLIQNAIISAFGGGDGGPKARIGSTIYASRFVAPIAALGSWVNMISLNIGSANTASATFTGSIGANGTLTVSALTTGTIGVGQVLTDLNGIILAGTTILTQVNGTVGGVGHYTVSIPQIVGSEAIQSVAANQNLVGVRINQVPIIAAPNIVVTVT